jgi:signal transduction histidine kinase
VGTGDDPPQAGQATEASIRALAEFLQESRGDILARWERAVRKVLGQQADGFDRLVDPFADLLDQFATLTEGDGAETITVGERHAPGAERSMDLGPLVTGYVLLRDTIVELWVPPPRNAAPALRMLDQAIDQAILGAVRRFSAAQEAAWRALDRVSALVRDGRELSALMDGLLRIVLESTASVHCAGILLRDGEELRLRATLGFEEDLERGFAVKVGEGFAGAVATRRAPVFLRWAARDPMVLGESVRRRGVRALYGVPLLDADELIGVAVIGSLTAFDVPEHDRRLFAAIADRATAAIQLQRLRQATHDQERQLAEVQDALRARDRVLSTVAHEVRTPIGIVLMQADSLAQRARAADGEWMPKRITSIHRAAERIDRLVENLVEFTNLRAGRLQFTIGTHPAADLVREAVEMFAPVAQERGIVVETELSAGLPDLSCDRERILQVLSLLTTNAARALADGVGRVAVRAQHDDVGVVFSVEDTGPGIDPADLPHLFDRAWRGERGKPGRSGVALAISKGIVEAHGGRIWAASDPRGGATFCFAVPTARA